MSTLNSTFFHIFIVLPFCTIRSLFYCIFSLLDNAIARLPLLPLLPASHAPPISVLMQAALPLPRIVPLLNDSHVFCVGIRLSSSLYSLPLPLSCRQNLCLSVSSGVSSYLLPHLCHAPNCCTGGSNIPLSAFLPR